MEGRLTHDEYHELDSIKGVFDLLPPSDSPLHAGTVLPERYVRRFGFQPPAELSSKVFIYPGIREEHPRHWIKGYQVRRGKFPPAPAPRRLLFRISQVTSNLPRGRCY